MASTLLNGLVAYYAMENLNDSSGNGHTLTNYGATLTTGKIGNGYYFNTGYLNINSASSFNQIRSISAWVKLNSFSRYNTIIAKRQLNGGWDYQIGFTINSGKLFYQDSVNYFETNYALPLNQFVFITMTYDTNNIRLYTNGNLFGTFTKTGQLSQTTTILNIGTEDYGNIFQGNIDELGIWNRALTQAEITNLYNNGNGLAYPFSTGYSKKINGVTPSKVNGISVANISKVNGI